MARVTLKTVAREAQVSPTTVSNAYNRPDQLSAELRERVLAVAGRLGYTGPDATARSLRRGRAGAIGVVLTETISYALSDPYAVEFLRGVAAVAERHDTGLLLVPVDQDDAEGAAMAIRQAVVDGFCLECVDDDHPVVDMVLGRGLPLVSTTRLPQREVPFVGIDERAAARAAADHLARLGHQRVGLVVDGRPTSASGGPISFEEAVERAVDHNTGLRVLGYREGLPEADLHVVAAGRNDREAARVAAGALLDRWERPTGVLAVSDVMALGVMDALRQRGLAPGADVSVVGFDDIPAAGDAGLTTIRQPTFDKGRIAGQLLLEPDEAPGRAVVLPTELMARGSSAPAPTHA